MNIDRDALVHEGRTEGIPLPIGPSNKAYEADVLNRMILHSYVNHMHIWNEFAEGKAEDLQILQGPIKDGKPEPKGPILVAGSGKNLDDIHDLIPQWRGAIICSASHASTFVHAGHPPEIIIGLDIKTDTSKMHVPDWGDTQSWYVVHPGMNPECIAFWTWNKAYFRVLYPKNYFYRRVMPAAYPMIKSELMPFACSQAAQLSVAAALGYSPLILVGADFACIDGWYRFKAWLYDEAKKAWYREEHNQTTERMLGIGSRFIPGGKVLQPDYIITDNGLVTEGLQIFYKKALFHVMRLDKVPVINCSPKGAITELPALEFEDAVARARDGRGFDDLVLPEQEYVDRIDTYLARHSMFTVCATDEKEVHFIEVEPGKELAMIRREAKAWAKIYEKQPDISIDVEGNVQRAATVLDMWRSRYPQDEASRSTPRAQWFQAAKQKAMDPS